MHILLVRPGRSPGERRVRVCVRHVHVDARLGEHFVRIDIVNVYLYLHLFVYLNVSMIYTCLRTILKTSLLSPFTAAIRAIVPLSLLQMKNESTFQKEMFPLKKNANRILSFGETRFWGQDALEWFNMAQNGPNCQR